MTIVVPRPPLAPFTEEAVFIGRSLRHSLRDVESLLMAIILPVVLMLVFTFVFGGAIDDTGEYVQYVVPGTVLTCAGFGAATTAVQVAEDIRGGMIDRLRTMPIRSSAILTGHVVASLARNLVATGIVVGVALLIGFRPEGSLTEWLGVVGLIALYLLALTYLFAAIGLVAGSPAAASGYGFILLFLPYLSSAFVPTSTLPTWLQWIAENQPLTPIIETLRALMLGTGSTEEAPIALLWCLGILAGAVTWSVLAFRRSAGRR